MSKDPRRHTLKVALFMNFIQVYSREIVWKQKAHGAHDQCSIRKSTALGDSPEKSAGYSQLVNTLGS